MNDREQRMMATLSIDETARQYADTVRGWARWLALVGLAYGDATDVSTVARSAADECERLAGAFRYLSDASAREADQASRSDTGDDEYVLLGDVLARYDADREVWVDRDGLVVAHAHGSDYDTGDDR